MNNMRMLSSEEENDDAAEVTWEDQQRINTFSKLNTRKKSIQDKLEEMKQEKDALDDLTMELELMDEDETVLYTPSTTFLHLPLPAAQAHLARTLAALVDELHVLEEREEACEKEMQALKAALYAKFGRAINLDD
ncbi:Prefoldin subunit 4 [Hygrophoropsis aurantiaca]|uniref:Prefoldin subunit 4 n=1 Tax=Hygrophoropsis aurantiaca TaxID=72124 RepID=A0ACB8A9Z5_9AGAM|nr:Prefoldin subunit 4 [Hygrophoropsis aurantiaca]